MESRLSFLRQHSSAQMRKRWDAVTGNDTSQGTGLCPTVKLPQCSSEYSAQDAWNWNYNNQNWNNNNKNNNNSLCAVRDSVEPQDDVVTLQDLFTAYEDCRHRKKRKPKRNLQKKERSRKRCSNSSTSTERMPLLRPRISTRAARRWNATTR